MVKTYLAIIWDRLLYISILSSENYSVRSRKETGRGDLTIWFDPRLDYATHHSTGTSGVRSFS